MLSIVDDWHDRHGEGAGGSAPAPLVSAGTETSPPAIPSQGPQPTIPVPAARGETRETAQYIGNLTHVTEFRTKSGTVHWRDNDDDYYRFTVSATRTVRLELGNLSADADLYLEDDFGDTVASSTNYSTRNESIVRELGPGTYYIRVDAGYSSDDIGYQLRYRREPEQGESRDTAFDIGNLAGAEEYRTRSGTVNRADIYRRFTLSRWRTMRFELRELTANADLYLEDATGRVLESSRRSGNGTESIVRELAPGNYFIRVDPVSSGDIRYQLRYRWDERPRGWTHQTAWYIGDLTNVTSYRTKPGSVNRRFDSSDIRRFRLTGARRMRFELGGLTGNANLYLEDENGRVLQSSRRSGTLTESIVRNLGEGTYYVRVDASASGSIRYRLRYRRESRAGETHQTAYDLGNLTNSSELLVKSGTVDYRIIRRFALTATRTMFFKLTGLSGNADLYLDDGTGKLIRSSRRSGTTDELIVRDMGPGRYFIRIEARASTGYQLQYRVVDRGTTRDVPYDLGNLTNATTLGSRAGTVNRIDNPDDFYRFTLTYKRDVWFVLRNLSADADLHLEDANGRLLKTSYNSGTYNDSIFEELGPGTYYIRVDAEVDINANYLLTFQTWGMTRATAYTIENFSSYTRTATGTVSRGEQNQRDYYRLSFSGSYLYTLEFRLGNLTGNANLFLEDSAGRLISSSAQRGTAQESIVRELRPGTYYIRVDTQSSGPVGYALYWRSTDSRYISSSTAPPAEASTASSQALWSDEPMSPPSTPTLDERRPFANAGGTLVA